MGKWITVNKAAIINKVSNTKIRRLIRDGLIRTNKEGKVLDTEVKKVLEMERIEKQKRHEENIELDNQIKMATAKYKEEKAKLAELKRLKEEGKLLDLEEVKHVFITIALTMRNQILSWKTKLVPLLKPLLKANKEKECAKIIHEQIDELLENLHNEEKLRIPEFMEKAKEILKQVDGLENA